MDADSLLSSALEGDRRALARLLRVVEDRRVGWEAVVAEAWRRAGSSHLIGITGSPGSGKSTLMNALVSAWRAVDRSVGIVAVDPSSPFTGGALLGDRVRMQDHIADPHVFVRSMSSRGRLGGLADASAALVTVLEAARFDPVVIETVGVGQSEVDVIDHADTVVVLVTPGWGDDIQADKAGILEIGDVFVINKADRPELADARRVLRSMLEQSPARDWTPPIVETVATADIGIETLIDALDRHRRHLTVTDEGRRRRRRRARALIQRAVMTRVDVRLENSESERLLDQVVARSLDPWNASRQLPDHPASR